MKIVVLDGHTENPGDLSWAELESMGELFVYERTPVDDTAEIIRRIADCEVVITNKTPLSAHTINACPNIRYIGLLSTGYNIADAKAARARNIPITNIPAYSTAAVAQFTAALLLELCHHVGHHNSAVKEGRWSACADFCFWDTPLTELAGKTMGIIGFGRIGMATAAIARALGMQVLAYNRSTTDEGKALATYVDIDTLYAKSDVISLHIPLFPETEGMINKDAISKMKKGALLINTARGALVNEQDLADALKSGKLAGAGLDVMAQEPPPPDSPLLNVDNCIITPHIAWASHESRARLMGIAAQNLRSFLDGTPQNVVN